MTTDQTIDADYKTAKTGQTLAQKTQEMLDSNLSDLQGFTETSLKTLHFFLAYILKIPSYKLQVYYKVAPPVAVIHTYTADGVEFFVKPKEKNMLPAVAQKMGVPHYVIRFANQDDTKGDEDE